MAYREGNTILTDGPICKFSVDSECRFNSGKDSSRWHDGSCAWENADGRIGGEGNFDGGGSVLISRDSEAMVNTVWDGRNDYISTTDGQPDNSEMILAVHSTGAVGGIMVMDGGPRGVAQHTKLAKEIAARLTERKDYAPSVLMLRANLGADETRASCITNPVWTIPVKFYYPSPPSECSIDAGDLRVSISFGVSMDSTLSDRCAGGDCLAPVNGSQAAYQGPTIKVYPLDGSGQSVGNGIRLTPRWYANNLAGPGFRKIENANLVGDNDVQIACPSGGWDATTHSVSPAIRSYAVVVTDLRDMHGNELNAIADTFTVTKGRTPKSPQRPSTGTGPVLDPNRAGGTQAVPCSSSSVTMCKSYGASCSAIAATNGSRQDVCAWSAANSAAACKRTAGIWTTAGSRYAKNHPGAVRPGQSGACLTEVKNLENRIQ
jgi:hypothetical protein